MLEKGQWPRAPNGVFSSSDGDSTKEGSSENTAPSSHDIKNNHVNSSCYEVCGNVAILGDKITDVDNNSFSDPLSGINHTGNNINFFENAEDKDSSDFLYYDWPDIANFEDVNRMFRSCDSTFGLGASKENGLDWFSSADNVGGSGDVMNSDFKFSCLESNPVENISPVHNSSKSYSFNDSDMMNASVELKDSPWMSDKLDSYASFVNGPAVTHGNEEFIPKAQMNEHQKQVKPQNQPEGKRKDHGFGNGCIDYMNKLPNEVLQISSSGTISHQDFQSVHMQQQQHALGSDHCNYLENHHSYMHTDSSPLSGLTSVNPTSSAVKSETNDLTSTSPRISSHPSNQLSFMDGFHDSPLTVTAPTGMKKREKLPCHQGARSSVDRILKHSHAMVHNALDDPGLIGKEAQFSGSKSENHSTIEDDYIFIPSELGSSNVQESSPTSSGTDDISLEAASFCQLQLVMEQLDLRTKVCIRDSLYRLARSAKQRHNNQANLSCGDGTSTSGAFMSEGENKLLDMETDTNEIDRSVAHLLFHRPPESSPTPAHDSPSTIVPSPHMMVENLNNDDEEIAAKVGGF